MTGSAAGPAHRVSERRIRFVDAPSPSDEVVASFLHPYDRHAVVGGTGDAQPGDAQPGDALDVVVVPPTDTGNIAASMGPAAATAYVKYRGVELLWRPGRAVLQCEPAQTDTLIQALAEFAHYEGELRTIEAEVAAAWGDVDRDKALAFDVTPTDLRRTDDIGTRMAATFSRRIRLARMEAHLFAPHAGMAAAGQKLGEALREQAHIEARAEVLDGQIEVFEHIYEMASQRMGEFRAARQGHMMEWVIIVLLAAESIFMALQAVMRGRG
jgi:hypothetical protein